VDIDKTAECMVASSEGLLRQLESEIPLSIIASVTTSLIARKRGLASRMTAALIAEAAQPGSELSALGMFERATTLDWDLELSPTNTAYSATLPSLSSPPKQEYPSD